MLSSTHTFGSRQQGQDEGGQFTVVFHDGRRASYPAGRSLAAIMEDLRCITDARVEHWLVRDQEGRLLKPQDWLVSHPRAGTVVTIAAPVRGG